MSLRHKLIDFLLNLLPRGAGHGILTLEVKRAALSMAFSLYMRLLGDLFGEVLKSLLQ